MEHKAKSDLKNEVTLLKSENSQLKTMVNIELFTLNDHIKAKRK